jgi:hypothetical protein
MIHKNVSFETRRSKKLNYKKFKKHAIINTGCDTKKQHSHSQMTITSVYLLSQTGMKLIKLLKLEDTGNFLGFVHNTILALLHSIFVKRISYQPRLFFSWAMPLAVLQTLLSQNNSGCQCCLYTIKK